MASPSDIRLVVNADDFGISPAVSRGILRAHREGVVTSTSVLGNCEDLGAVRALLAEAPGLGVGVHLTLLGGRPISPPDALPTLVRPDGTFHDSVKELFVPFVKGRIDVAEIEREFDSQVRRVAAAGLRVDHLDTHHHMGFLPPVGWAMETVARQHKIPGVRSAVERPTLAWVTEPQRGLQATLLTGLAWLTRRQMGALRHGPQSWGYVESGRLDEIRILEILGRLGPGSHELICHPGEEDDADHDRKHELDALRSAKVRRALEGRGVQLCSWRDLF